MFILYDSRARSQTGRRQAHEFAETAAGVLDVWRLVIAEEVPNEHDDYIFLAFCDPAEAPEIFNSYWGVYGWNLNAYDADIKYPSDVDVITEIME